LAAWLIAKVGWRAAYALLGSTCGLVTMLAALTVRLPRTRDIPEPRAPGPRVPATTGLTLAQALGDMRQWVLNVSWLLLGALSLMVSVHIVPFAHDQGISLAGASLALTAYGIGAVSGRVVSGIVSVRRRAVRGTGQLGAVRVRLSAPAHLSAGTTLGASDKESRDGLLCSRRTRRRRRAVRHPQGRRRRVRGGGVCGVQGELQHRHHRELRRRHGRRHALEAVGGPDDRGETA